MTPQFEPSQRIHENGRMAPPVRNWGGCGWGRPTPHEMQVIRCVVSAQHDLTKRFKGKYESGWLIVKRLADCDDYYTKQLVEDLMRRTHA